ncbi:MAG: hypothetical protein OHK93_000583 [Ramalina farinacea]|uniref:Signal recognition particle receptor subunit alpha homolog n=1 Tax=Ramalina farinacea TaxID=258253 RepID=A0AA43TSQ2_9LECA|nr:hypothetical protein [Ramalina farinacea]
MLDSFEIFTTSGVVLWSKSYTKISPSLINNFVKDVFIEEKVLPGATAADDASASKNPSYKRDQYTLRWTSATDLGLIFVVWQAVYQSILHLTWIDKLLDNLKVIFTDLYGEQLRKPHTSVVECDFDQYFDQQIQELESSASKSERNAPQIHIQDAHSRQPSGIGADEAPPPPIPGLGLGDQQLRTRGGGISPNSTPNSSRPNTPGSQVLAGGNLPKGASRRAKKAAAGALNAASSGDEKKSKGKKDSSKKMRRWDDDGTAGEDDGAVLDYSAQSNGAPSDADMPTTGSEPVDMAAAGSRTSKGQFVLKDLDSEVHSMLQNAEDKKIQQQPSASKGMVESSLGAISGLFRNVVGGKVLTKSDLDKPIKGMEEHLLKKNVAREAAVRLCESVEKELIGPFATKPRPYVISIVGVNGVGKSTNLSKLAFFLLQNNFSLLIAACDTFRSGAVEQLRVHARNLKELSEREHLGVVELYERGYGKDAANIAKDAIAYAAQQAFDVVLIDTAGRRHNDTRLMSSLDKFAQFAKPDKILMVGEALVGTDSVAQARAFNQAFGKGRRLDGFIISKCDTVGDMVGSLVSMVHATGIPVVFLGVGQHYGDLRTLNVTWAVQMLMS